MSEKAAEIKAVPVETRERIPPRARKAARALLILSLLVSPAACAPQEFLPEARRRFQKVNVPEGTPIPLEGDRWTEKDGRNDYLYHIKIAEEDTKARRSPDFGDNVAKKLQEGTEFNNAEKVYGAYVPGGETYVIYPKKGPLERGEPLAREFGAWYEVKMTIEGKEETVYISTLVADEISRTSESEISQ